jgi:hypothetical protein
LEDTMASRRATMYPDAVSTAVPAAARPVRSTVG